MPAAGQGEGLVHIYIYVYTYMYIYIYTEREKTGEKSRDRRTEGDRRPAFPATIAGAPREPSEATLPELNGPVFLWISFR